MDSRNSKHFGKIGDGIDAHLSDEVLLLGVDGELGAREAAQGRLHLEACWACRTRREQINDSIAQVVEYSNCMIRTHFPPSESGPARFAIALRALVEKSQRPSIWRRLKRLTNFTAGLTGRPMWIESAAVACIAAVLLASLRSTLVVSAAEVVRESAQSEQRRVQGIPHPVIYQKFRIESSGNALDRAVYIDPVAHRQVESQAQLGTEPELGTAAARLRATFSNAHLDWADPLSISSFEAWQSSNSARADQVDRSEAGLISIRSTVSAGPVAEVRFTMRKSDLHPVSESVFLRDWREIRITEADFEVFSLNAIDPSLFSLKDGTESRLTPPTKPIRVASRTTYAPSEKQLQESEMRARVALHAVGADLGDQIALQRGARNTVVVEGVVNSPERKQEVEAELTGIESVQAHLVIPSDVIPDQASNEMAIEMIVPSAVVNDTPLLKPILKTKFPDTDERRAFVDNALESIQSAMAHAWAVRRLQERYSDSDVAQLDAPARQMLELLIRDHATAIRASVEREAVLLEGLIPSQGGPGDENARRPADGDWRDLSQQVFTELEKVQHDGDLLLAGSPVSEDPAAVSAETARYLQALRRELPALCEQVSGNFLAKRSTIDP
jgi:hypothetical protein